jgi:uncharacterized repeat protein (TIGR02543 family)
MKHSIFSLLMVMILVSMLLACQNQKTYTISFDTLTESEIEPIEALEGQSIFAPENPNRTGYRFDGWLYEDQPFVFGVMPKGNITLTAKWSKYYQVTFDTDGGSLIPSLMIAEGDDIELTDIPFKDHYKFSEWLYSGSSFNLSKMPSEDIVLTASWLEATTITFIAVVYDRHLGIDVNIEVGSMLDVPGAIITPPNAPEYAEYKFLSWQHEGVDFDFNTMPDEDITLYATWIPLSNLPALFIDLFDESQNSLPIENVTRETYVESHISLINTTQEFTILEALAEFKGRGNGSWVDSGEKKGYRIKFDSSQNILGNDISKHWVILAGANFDDITMFRNKLAFNMTEEIFTNIEYASSAEWVDVYFNNQYHGVYLIAEHIRVNEDRINIISEYGINDTGYLIEYDAYASGTVGIDYFRVPGMKYPFTVKSPSPEDYLDNGITTEQFMEQVNYIKALTTQMVTAALAQDLTAFAEYADVNSFLDMYILHELFKNIDTGYSSFFIYRHAGGKLFAGPPWDFDATLGSSPTRGNGGPTGIYVALSVQAFSSRTANELMIKLYATPAFKTLVIARWIEISGNILTYVNQTLSNAMINEYRFALGRNYVRWPSPQGYGPAISQQTAETNWANNIGILRKWLQDRIAWLNNEWK